MSAKTSLESIKSFCLENGFEFMDEEYENCEFKHNFKCLKHGEIYPITFDHLRARKRLKCCGAEKLNEFYQSQKYSRVNIEKLCSDKNIELVFCLEYVGQQDRVIVRCDKHRVEKDIKLLGLLKSKRLQCCMTNGKILNKKFTNKNVREIKTYSIEKVSNICSKLGFEFLDKQWNGSFGKYRIKCLKHRLEQNIDWDTFISSKKLRCCHKENVKIGPDSLNYKHNISHDERQSSPHRRWALEIKNKNNFLCNTCREAPGQGLKSALHSHHLYSWKDFPSLREDINNGVCLCKKCHIDFHRKYGSGNNTKEQFEEFKIKHKK